MTDTSNHSPVTTRRTRGKNKSRLSLMIRPGLAMEFHGAVESLDQAIEVTETLLGRLKSSRKLGLRMSTVEALLRDQCEAIKASD